jgi:hypothetical protein
MEIVSLPSAAVPEEEEPVTGPTAPDELVVERPDATPPRPQPEAAIPPPTPTTRREPPPEREVQREETPPPTPTREQPRPTPAPETDTGATGDEINVRMEGLRRDYPVYYENIIVQIRRCFRWQSGGRWTTRIRFEIARDGSVSNIRVVQPSGSFPFDIEAEGAIECAGRGRFGALPDDLPFDRLPIEFVFTPEGM